jgi:signal transduction histidine kinase
MTESPLPELAGEHIRSCRELPLPVLLCDLTLRVWWNNGAAARLYPHLTGGEDLRGILAEFEPAVIFEEIETRGCATLEQVMPLSGESLSFLPVREGERLRGALVYVLPTAMAPLPGRDRSSGRTATALDLSVRRQIDDIFEAMDAAYLKAVMLDGAVWLSPHLNRISVGAYRILRTTLNIAEYAHLQSGEMVWQPAAVNLFEGLREMRDVVEDVCATAGVPVTFDIPDEDVFLLLDRQRLELAFYNVLYNSVTYTRPGNHVEITARREDATLWLTVEDHGIGIPQSLLEEVFLPYRSYPPEGVAPGVGLGLTLARRLVETQGGTFTLTSREGAGTVVRICFPDRSFSQPLPLAQGDAPPLNDRFAPLYIGLAGVLDKPFDGSKRPGDLAEKMGGNEKL